MRIIKWLNVSVLLVFIYGCDKPLPELEGVNGDLFEQDKNACNKIRSTMRGAIDDQKKELLALNQMQIVKLLGRPDVNELSSRNQKFFYYFLEPAPDCSGAKADSSAERLVIRFNAVGLAKEVAVER